MCRITQYLCNEFSKRLGIRGILLQDQIYKLTNMCEEEKCDNKVFELQLD